jgi:hypothetical protein
MKTKKVKDSLKGWGNNLKGDRKKDKLLILSELENLENLEETTNLYGDEYTRKSTIQYLLMQIYEAEEKMWRERERER